MLGQDRLFTARGLQSHLPLSVSEPTVSTKTIRNGVYSEDFGNGPRNFETWSSDEDDTWVKTDGSRSDTCRARRGIFSNTPGKDVKISIRNSDHCSVFRSELISTSGALNCNKDSIGILTNSRSPIQYLKDRPKIMDSTDLDIIPN
ncbi:RNase H domain-containing protein [Trichonephila clavipes]|nr:RNase H domain-containing protein [Trichonephila clavipes]